MCTTPASPQPPKRRLSPLGIASLYMAAAGLWILATDWVVKMLTSDPEITRDLSTIKGWGFVLVTGLLLYGLISRIVNDLKRSEDARRQSETQYRAIVERVPAITYIAGLDETGSSVYVSPQIEAILGFTSAEWLADPALWFKQLHSDDRERVLAALRHSHQTGEPLRLEYRLAARDGRSVWIRDEATITGNHAQQRFFRQGLMTDVTDRKHAEEAEREQRTLAEALRDTAEVLNSTLDFDELLDHILATIGRVAPHDAATIMLIEAGVTRVVRWRGYAEATIKLLQFQVDQTPNLQQMSETRSPVLIPDIDPSRWFSFPEMNWERSYVGAPIRIKDEVVGFLNLISKTPGFFTPTHASHLQAFANQAAIAIQNARLFEEAQRQLRQQTALLAASNAISSSFDLPTMLNHLAEQMCRAIDATSAYISNWDPTTNVTTVMAEYDSPAASARERVSDLGATDANDYTRWLIGDRTLVIQVDDPATPVAVRDHLLQYDCQSILAIPLIAKKTIFGYAELWESRRRREFTRAEMELGQAIAQQAAIAFENVRLVEAERSQLVLARTLQAVGALVTAEMELDDVFQHIFDLLGGVVKYDCCSIELFDENNQVYLAAQRGFPDPERALYSTQYLTGPSIRERWGQQKVSVIPDTRLDSRWEIVPGFEFIRSRVGVWLSVKNRLLGILNVDSRTVNAYDDAIGETVAAFANQAAIAIENAQLSKAIRRYAAELEQRVIERTAELDHERRRTQAILDTAGEGVLFTDRAGRIEYVNRAMEELTGYTAAETLGRNPNMWQSGLTPREIYAQMWNTIRRGEVWHGELINRHKDGSLYDTALTIAPLRDVEQQISGYVGVQRDITRQKELDRLKDQFVSNVSHEFRTPLANVKLYLRLLDRGKPEKRDQYMQTLRREAQRLENLIEDLLDISRLDMGAAQFRLGPIDLHPLLAQIINDRMALAAERDLAFDYQPAASLPEALANPGMLGQVMSNLMSNAINYTPRDGVITIATATQHDPRDASEWDTITIRDTGPGITAQDKPHLFERFYRGEAARQSGAPGTGLGLAICQEIIERMEGRITVESEPHQGAAFTIWLKSAG